MTAAAQEGTVAQTTTGALAIRPDQTQFDTFQLAALRQMGVEEAPNGDLAVFLHYSQRTGLDPFARQIYMIKRDGKWVIQAGIDGLRIVAQRSHEYAGQAPVQWCGADGKWTDVWLSTDPPSAARVGVQRRGFIGPLYAVALWREYAAFKREGGLTRVWATRGAGQLAKCAEALALRKAFPMDLSGIYIAEEFDADDALTQAGTPAADEAPTRLDTADAETVARLRRNVLGATDVEGTRDLLQATWDEALALHARDCEVQVPEAWQELAKAERVTLGALIVGAAQAHAKGIAHGEDLTADDGVVDADVVDVDDGAQPEPCTNRSGGRYCTREQGHDGRHAYPPKDEATAPADLCGADAGGWPCTLPTGHVGDHQV